MVFRLLLEGSLDMLDDHVDSNTVLHSSWDNDICIPVSTTAADRSPEWFQDLRSSAVAEHSVQSLVLRTQSIA